MKTYQDLIQECLPHVQELLPWDLAEKLAHNQKLLLLDIREPYEFDLMHIPGSINVPRGVLESACDWDYEETVPELVQARTKEIIILCRSGYRSVLAAFQMQLMGYQNVISLKTGIRGWNDYEQLLEDKHHQPIAMDDADVYFASKLRAEQKRPKLHDFEANSGLNQRNIPSNKA